MVVSQEYCGPVYKANWHDIDVTVREIKLKSGMSSYQMQKCIGEIYRLSRLRPHPNIGKLTRFDSSRCFFLGKD